MRNNEEHVTKNAIYTKMEGHVVRGRLKNVWKNNMKEDINMVVCSGALNQKINTISVKILFKEYFNT